MNANFGLENPRDLEKIFEEHVLTTKEAKRIIGQGVKDVMGPVADVARGKLASTQTREPSGTRKTKSGTRKPLAVAMKPAGKVIKANNWVGFIRAAQGYHLWLADRGTHRSKGLDFMDPALSLVNRSVTDILEAAHGKLIKFVNSKNYKPWH